MSTPNLDDPQIYKDLDPAGMLARIREMPRQCQQAWQMAMGFQLPSDYSEVNKVVILGMGGSAIGGDLVKGLAGEARVPILVQRDYRLPAFVDARTLVIASSYSGETEETLSAFAGALATESKKLVITTGGKMKAAAEQRHVPVFSFSYKAQPRAALGFSLFPILCFLQRLGFLSDRSADVAETVRALEEMSRRMNEFVPVSSNPAKQLAQRLHGRLPVIYGEGATAEVAHRWKTQFNENSKAWAFYEVFSELNHNAVVGYEFPKEIVERVRVVLLRTPSLEPRMRLRYRVTGELLDRAGVGHEFVDGTGSSALSQVMGLVLHGDYVSYYLAILYLIDPSPVKVIDYLKAQLAKE